MKFFKIINFVKVSVVASVVKIVKVVNLTKVVKVVWRHDCRIKIDPPLLSAVRRCMVRYRAWPRLVALHAFTMIIK